MASLSTDANGNRTIQFIGRDKKRRSIRLGQVAKKTAESIRLRVKELNSLLIAKLPLDAEMANWVATIGDDLAAKIAAVGLIPERQSQALGKFLDDYMIRRRADAKGSTITHMRTVSKDLKKFFGEGKPLREIGELEAQNFRQHYLERSLALCTSARRLNTVKQFFEFARQLKFTPGNVFEGLTIAGGNPKERQHYVPLEDVGRLMGVANSTWQTILALSRYAGLRCPSEVLLLELDGVSLTNNRMVVISPKTEHLVGKEQRVVPIFPMLRPFLETAVQSAPPGAAYVVHGEQADGYRRAAQHPDGWANSNLRTQLLKFIKRAGLKPWPKLFHNMRASCETDLMQNHPIHAVTNWIGNTPAVALRHYLQVTEVDFTKAVASQAKSKEETGGAESGAVVVQKAVHSEAIKSHQETAEPSGTLESEGFRRLLMSTDVLCSNEQMGVTGFEPVTPTMSTRKHESAIFVLPCFISKMQFR
jgi:integrase